MRNAALPLFESNADTLTATNQCRGPWNKHSLHGGPVAAVMAHALEGADGSVGFFPSRFSMELRRPIGVQPVRVKTSIQKDGRNARVVAAEMADESDNTLCTATLFQIRTANNTGPIIPFVPPTPAPPPAETCQPVTWSWSVDYDAFHTHATEHRLVPGVSTIPGQNQQWIRVHAPLFEHVPLTPFQQAAAVSDFSNGVSAVQPLTELLFINPDLVTTLVRLPQSEWICVDAETSMNGSGVGLAHSRLWDTHGVFGFATQTLLVEKPS